MIKNNFKIIIVALILFVLIIIFMWLLSINIEDDKNINLYEVSNVNDSKDPVVRDIYHQFNPEDDILFNIFGSGTNNDSEYFAYYYKNGKITLNQLDNVAKTYLTIHSYDYRNSSVNVNNNCYEVSVDDLSVTYGKLFDENNLLIDNSFKNIKLDYDGKKVCIYDSVLDEYTYTLDTMFVNATYQENELLIYERVMFIKVDDVNMEFYSDYEMNDLVYKGKRSDINFSFVNNLNIVSNVLINYQDKFDIYTYTFEKKGEHYYFKNISR